MITIQGQIRCDCCGTHEPCTLELRDSDGIVEVSSVPATLDVFAVKLPGGWGSGWNGNLCPACVDQRNSYQR